MEQGGASITMEDQSSEGSAFLAIVSVRAMSSMSPKPLCFPEGILLLQPPGVRSPPVTQNCPRLLASIPQYVLLQVLREGIHSLHRICYRHQTLQRQARHNFLKGSCRSQLPTHCGLVLFWEKFGRCLFTSHLLYNLCPHKRVFGLFALPFRLISHIT